MEGATDRIVDALAGGQLVDLDQYLADQTATAPRFRLHGDTIRCQAEAPFDLILRLYRELEQGTKGKDDELEADPELVMEVVAAAVGPEAFQRWRSRGIGLGVAKLIMTKAIEFWGLNEEATAGGEGEAAAPGSGPSSNGGGSSSPTSNANTASTSSPSGAGSAGPDSGGSWPA
jgi:hypothetical protein